PEPPTPDFSPLSLHDALPIYYLVSAYNSYGQSANSAEISVTPAAPPPPAVPTGLAATAGNMQVALSWTASSGGGREASRNGGGRSEEHTSELPALRHLVCRPL